MREQRSQFAECLRSIRKSAGLTQGKLAEICGMSKSSLQKYEIGERGGMNPSIKALTTLGNALNKYDPLALEKLVSAVGGKAIMDSAKVEVIRCKDCKWWDKKDDSPYGYCFAAKHGYYSRHWEISIYRTYEEDFYCADAEWRANDG